MAEQSQERQLSHGLLMGKYIVSSHFSTLLYAISPEPNGGIPCYGSHSSFWAASTSASHQTCHVIENSIESRIIQLQEKKSAMIDAPY
jgi:hypothetical protein